MKALILNSGLGSRMGSMTKTHPKCMTEIHGKDTILSRQLKMLEGRVDDIVITTGYYDEVLTDYCSSLGLAQKITFVKNPQFDSTNYIYSIYCARDELKGEEILLMHGDLVFEQSVLDDILTQEDSCVAVSAGTVLPEKDFKAVIKDGYVVQIGVEFFDNAFASQPLYKLNMSEWTAWLGSICHFCESGNVNCYAENAWNELAGQYPLLPFEIDNRLCREIDNPEDLEVVKRRLKENE